MTVLIAKMPWGEKIKLRVDLAQASAPIHHWDGDEWASTPFQTADARHDDGGAVRVVLDWFGRGYFAADDDERDSAVIIDEVMGQVSITREDEEQGD